MSILLKDEVCFECCLLFCVFGVFCYDEPDSFIYKRYFNIHFIFVLSAFFDNGLFSSFICFLFCLFSKALIIMPLFYLYGVILHDFHVELIFAIFPLIKVKEPQSDRFESSFSTSCLSGSLSI